MQTLIDIHDHPQENSAHREGCTSGEKNITRENHAAQCRRKKDEQDSLKRMTYQILGNDLELYTRISSEITYINSKTNMHTKETFFFDK